MKNKSRRSQSIQVFVDKIPQSCQESTSQQILYNSQKVQKTQELQPLILQVSASMLTIKIHDSFNKYGLFEGVAGKKPLLLQKNRTVWLKFAKLHLKKPQEVFGQTRPKRRCLAILLSTMFGKNKYLMSTAKHAGTGRVMIWVCFAAWKLGALHSLSWPWNLSHLRPSVQELKVGWYTTAWPQKKGIKVSQCQSADLSLTVMLWWDHKRSVYKRMPANLHKLMQCCKLKSHTANHYFKLLQLKVVLQATRYT